MHNPFLFLAVLGDITQKEYEKKRSKLLSPYSPQTQGKRGEVLSVCLTKEVLSS